MTLLFLLLAAPIASSCAFLQRQNVMLQVIQLSTQCEGFFRRTQLVRPHSLYRSVCRQFVYSEHIGTVVMSLDDLPVVVTTLCQTSAFKACEYLLLACERGACGLDISASTCCRC